MNKDYAILDKQMKILYPSDSTIKKIIIFITLTSFMFLSLFGMNMVVHNHMGQGDGVKTSMDCPFMQNGSICKMSFLEHIQAWQSVLLATFTQIDFVLILFGLSFLFYPFLYQKILWRLREKSIFSKIFQYIKYTQKNSFSLFIYLFSVGILNPKLF